MNGNVAKSAGPPPPSPKSQLNGDITDILIGSIIGFNYLILLPIFICCTHILYKNRKIQIFRSRRPITLQYILGITFIIFVLVHPFRLFDGSIPNISYKLPLNISLWISSSIEYSITLALLLCYLQRSYLIHYDFNYHEAILNNEWKQFTSLNHDENIWYLTNRNKYGNRTFTLYIIIAIWLILTAILTGAAYHFNIEAHWVIIQLILFVIVEVFICKLILKMPGLDVFRIRDEYMYLLGILGVLILIITFLLIFYDEHNPQQIIISRLIYHCVCMIGTVSVAIISVIYPYRVHYAIQEDLNNKEIYHRQTSTTARSRKYSNTASKSHPNIFIRRLKSVTKKESIDTVPTKTNTNISPNLSPQFTPRISPRLSPQLSPRTGPMSCPSPIHLNSNAPNNSSPRLRPKSVTEMIERNQSTPITLSSPTSVSLSGTTSRVSLDELMKYLVGIEAFLKHLVKELSAENLFFLSDIVQYKRSFVDDGILDEVYGWSMEFPSDIPRSHILNEPDHYSRAQIICNKYIRTNSEREINISWSARSQIVNKFDQLDIITKPEPIDYSIRFDFAADEIRKLLADSFRRFCLTPEYKKFCRDYNTRVRRIQRKFSKSIRSVTRELSRDRSVSKEQHDGHLSNSLYNRSPKQRPNTQSMSSLCSVKRLNTYSSRSNQRLAKLTESPRFEPKYSPQRTIIENKEEETENNILPPMSLSNIAYNYTSNTITNTSLKHGSGLLTLPETGSPLNNNNNNTLTLTLQEQQESSKSYTSSQDSVDADNKKHSNVIKNSITINNRRSKGNTETMIRQSDHLSVRMKLHDYGSGSASATSISTDDDNDADDECDDDDDGIIEISQTPIDNDSQFDLHKISQNGILSVLVPTSIDLQNAMTPPPRWPHINNDNDNDKSIVDTDQDQEEEEGNITPVITAVNDKHSNIINIIPETDAIGNNVNEESKSLDSGYSTAM